LSIFITGGAGFVGSSLAKSYRSKFPARRIVVFDNLKRRGAELNLPEFKKLNIDFVHGDIRQPDDLEAVEGSFDLFIEASAEPSVHAGADGKASYLLHTNLTGTLNCLEWARQRCAHTLFLSTSRVYSIPALNEIPLRQAATRFELDTDAQLATGLCERGIGEKFDVSRFRSLYGATKLASELVIQEYCALYGMKILINRCGVIAGPGQWGKADQGVYTLWVANHFFGKALKYIGYGGYGKQVRDLLHPQDLFALLEAQLEKIDAHSGEVFNVGGGLDISTSLLEYTQLCAEITGNEIAVGQEPATNPLDVPYYISDYRRATETFAWQPQKTVRDIVSDIHNWLSSERERVEPIFC
jgi:CDP-paratose 2-epimerase